MSRKSPSQLKILNDTLDLMTLMTHYTVCLSICLFRAFEPYPIELYF